jgi:hypothetical protein
MKYDLGTFHFRDFRHRTYMLQRWAYPTKIEGLQALKKARDFSDRYRRNETSVLFKDKIKSGVGKGKIVYVVGTRGNL